MHKAPCTVLILFGALALSLQAQPKPVWTASGSIDNDGDGVADRSLDRKGYDDDDDGKADRTETTEKNDNNNDGDFDDPGETTMTTETITGNAKAEIQMEDPVNKRRVKLRWEDTNGNGKADKKEISICDTSRPGLPSPEQQSSLCGEEKALVSVGSMVVQHTGRVVTEVQQCVQTTLPNLTGGCQSTSRKRVWHTGIFQLGGTFFNGWSADIDDDGNAEFFGSNNVKNTDALRMGPPGYYGTAYSLFPEACDEGPRSEFGTIGVNDLNWDFQANQLHVVMDPIQTTYEATITDVEPVIVPHFANGADGLITYLLSIDNPSLTETLTGLIEVRGNDGALVPTGFVDEGNVSQIGFEIPPLGKADFETTGVGDLVVGSLRIFADGPIGAVGRFDLTGIGIAGVGARDPNASAIIPVRRVGELSTGVAYTNAVDETITLTFTLKDTDGNALGTTDVELVAGGHDAKFIEELFDDIITGDFEGTLCITASFGTFVGEALELAVNAQVFTAIPVTPLAP